MLQPNKDCAHLLGEYTPTIVNDKVVGSTLTDWCCGLNGCQSCGSDDCPTDRKHANAHRYKHLRQQGRRS